MITLRVRRARGFEGVEADIADAFEEATTHLAALPALQDYAVPGKDTVIEVVLGGREAAAMYDVVPEALGFFAVSSQARTDEDAPLDPDDEDADPPIWYEVPDGFEAHVNVEAAWAHLSRDWDGLLDFEKAIEIEAAVVTIPHEVLHALEWVRETGGMTPGEVYDAGPGELALRRTLDAIDASHKGLGRTEEDVEDLARGWTASILSGGEADAVVERIDAVLAPAAPSP